MRLDKYLFYATTILILFTFRQPLARYFNAYTNRDSPQVVLVLGGDVRRESAGAEISKNSKIPLVISSGSNPEYANWLIKEIGLTKKDFSLDYRAKDTLTNFTSLVDEFSSNGINHVLMVTSADHILRAKIVGNIIAGSRSIKLTSLSVPCEPNCIKESSKKQVVDIVRAIVWVITGKDLKLFRPNNFGLNKINQFF